jgi:hypothetical protein
MAYAPQTTLANAGDAITIPLQANSPAGPDGAAGFTGTNGLINFATAVVSFHGTLNRPGAADVAGLSVYDRVNGKYVNGSIALTDATAFDFYLPNVALYSSVKMVLVSIGSGSIVADGDSTPSSLAPAIFILPPVTIASTPQTISAASTTALAVGPNGTTNPTLVVNTNTASAATGLTVISAAAASGVALNVISSGTNESLTISAKGTGNISLLGTTNPGLKLVGVASAATGLQITPAAAASGLAIAVISSGTNEAATLDTKGTGSLSINGTATGQVYLGRGGLNVTVQAVTLTSLGTNQNSTPTAAQIIGGLLTQTGATGAGTVTLPSGTTLSTAMAVKGLAPVAGDSFMVPFASLTGQQLTITGATGTTVIGTAAIPSGKNAMLFFYNSGSNTWNIYVVVSA